MRLTNLLNEIKHYLKHAEISKAFKAVEELHRRIGIKDTTEFISLFSQWNQNNRDRITGTIPSDEIRRVQNGIVSHLQQYVDLIIKTEKIQFDDNLTYSREKQILDKESEHILRHLLSCLEKEERELKSYAKKSKWVIFPNIIRYLQPPFNKDIYNFLDLGNNLKTKHLRLELIEEIKDLLGDNKFIPKDTEQAIEETIIELLIENNDEKIKVDDFLDKFIDKVFKSLNFDFRDKVYTHLRVFSEKFAKGQLSLPDSKQLRPGTPDYVQFFVFFGRAFDVDSENITTIVEAINYKQTLKTNLYPATERIVYRLNTQRQKDFIKTDIKIFKSHSKDFKRFKEQHKKSTLSFGFNQKGLLTTFAISTLMSILSIFIYDTFFNKTSTEVAYEEIDELREELKVLNKELDKKHKLLKIEVSNQIDTLDKEVKHFNAQNEDIMNYIKKVDKKLK